jgi:broad specificity polyphosphatase/5'/3'-nucleotidase SurE
VAAATDWVVRLAASPVVRDLPPGSFLTASLPRTPPDEIRGVRLTRRADFHPEGLPVLVRAEGAGEGGEEIGETWQLLPPERPLNRAEGDVAAYEEGWIALTVLTVVPTDASAHAGIERRTDQIPVWQPDGGR